MKEFQLIFLIFRLCYCSNNKRGNENIKVNLSNGDYAIIPISLGNLGDTLFNGTGKYYTKKGELIDEIEFVNSKKNGWHFHYDSGKLVSKIPFSDDVAQGRGFVYNKFGKIEIENYYQNNKTRVSKFFDSSGNGSIINFYDDNLAFFAIKYDNLGRIITQKGVVFAHNFDSNQKLDSVKASKLLEIKIPVVVLPEFFTNIEIVKFDPNNKIYESIDSVPINDYCAVFKTTFDKIGLHMLGIAGELKDLKGNIIKRDTLYQRINIIK